MPARRDLESQYANLSPFFVSQQRTFVMWVNSKLIEGGNTPVASGKAAAAAFQDGTVSLITRSLCRRSQSPMMALHIYLLCKTLLLYPSFRCRYLSAVFTVTQLFADDLCSQVVAHLLQCLTQHIIKGINWKPKNPLVVSSNWSILFKVQHPPSRVISDP